MRLFITIMFFSLIYTVFSKNHVKSLTESMGQEVIEIGAPIKELPMGLEEEPSADNDDDEMDNPKTTITATTTKKDVKKTTTLADVKKNIKDIEKIDGVQDDEETRIEKELAEIYKDTADYKSDIAEEKDVAKVVTKEPSSDKTTEELAYVEDTEKPIARQKNFKFQPDTTNKADIERFRTSIDSIDCSNRQKLKVTPEPGKKTHSLAFNNVSNGILLITAMLSYVFICN